MGYFTLTVLTSFTFLLTYIFLINGAHAKLVSPLETSATPQNSFDKRPVMLLKSFPIRKLRSLGLYRREPPEVEFADDTINDVEKRFDDYGHLR